MSTGILTPPNMVDQVKAFMLFTYFGGDAKKTASAARCDVRVIEALAHDFNWNEKIIGTNRLDTPEGIKAEREANRAANYVMGKRLITILETLYNESEDSVKFLTKICTMVDLKGNTYLSTKPLMEIAKTFQMAGDITYRALGDKIAVEANVAEEISGDRVKALASGIYGAMAKLHAQVKKTDLVAPAINISSTAISTALDPDVTAEQILAENL